MASNLCQSKICSRTKTRKSSTQNLGRLTIQCPKGYRSAYDELWSFVDNKGNKQWVWLALDANTREIVGVDLGARLGEGS